MERRLRSQLDRRRGEGTLRCLLPLPRRPACGAHAFATLDSKSLQASESPIDFSSNDYLGLARCPFQHKRVQREYEGFLQGGAATTTARFPSPTTTVALGATGSRLLSGDSKFARSIEARLADVHNRPATLICNSGYDANLSVLSSVPLPGDLVVMDELVHNSLVMGLRMSRLNEESTMMFRHNDVSDLEMVLRRAVTKIFGNMEYKRKTENSEGKSQQVIVVVESVYSMDGDIAPLKEILELSSKYGASVIVDEAHGLGVYGRSNMSNMILPESQSGSDLVTERLFSDDAKGGKVLVVGTGVLAALELETHPALLCSVHTFGKAAGCHGAVIAASDTVIDFLVNYARPFIYSTALPLHSLVAISCAYEVMTGAEGEERRKSVFRLVRLFRRKMVELLQLDGNLINSVLVPSPSPIQAVLVPGNEKCIALSNRLRSVGNFHLYPIRSPTVPKGQERIRIILHSHNSNEEVKSLVDMLASSIEEFGLVPVSVDGRSKISRL